jgi:hypothetical protein
MVNHCWLLVVVCCLFSDDGTVTKCLVGKKYKNENNIDSWDTFGGKYDFEDKSIVDMCLREADEETLQFMKEEKELLKIALEDIFSQKDGNMKKFFTVRKNGKFATVMVDAKKKF